MNQDEILAKRLYELELEEQRRRQEAQNRSDEEIARRLAEEYANENSSALRQQPQSRKTHIRAGQKAVVRLNHPHSGNFIGEVFNAKYVESNMMMFELKGQPGFRLRVAPESGKVEFSNVMDGACMFQIELITPQGPLYIISRDSVGRRNIAGGTGWYLTLLEDGSLIGNGGRGVLGQWILVAAPEEVTPTQRIPPANDSSSNDFETSSNPILQESSRDTSRNTAMSSMGAIGPNGLTTSKKISGADPGREASVDEQMQWLNTASGQSFLNELSSPLPKHMYMNGTIRKILYRPDWPTSSSRFREYSSVSDIPKLDRKIANQYLTPDLQRDFFENGFVSIANVISPQLVTIVKRLALYWSAKHTSKPHRIDPRTVELVGAISSDYDVLSMLYGSPIIHMVQQLIGDGEISVVKEASVRLTYPSLVDPPTSLEGQTWTIDGFSDVGGHSPYTLLVGIALADMTEPFQGNFCGFPTSQVLLQEYFKTQVNSCGTDFSEPEASPQKPFLFEPTQILMKAGDVFLCSHKVAKFDSVHNMTDDVKPVVFFKISHIDHDVLKVPALDGIWVEFKGADILDQPNPSAKANISKMKQSTEPLHTSATAFQPQLIDFMNADIVVRPNDEKKASLFDDDIITPYIEGTQDAGYFTAPTNLGFHNSEGSNDTSSLASDPAMGTMVYRKEN